MEEIEHTEETVKKAKEPNQEAGNIFIVDIKLSGNMAAKKAEE